MNPTGAARLRARLEVLRAPLLLTPSADVLGGAAWAAASARADLPWTDLAVAALTGTALLASGMAHNAWADRAEDRRLKPERPLARGALRPADVLALWWGGAALALLGSAWLPALLPATVAILIVSQLYHFGLKRWRLTGCLALGTARGLDVALGAALVLPGRDAWWLAPLLYGAYVAAASLHASTDDEAPGRPLGRRGVLLAQGLLGAQAVALLAVAPLPWALAGATLFGFVALRLHRATRQLPPPAVTGALLSALPLLMAAWALGAARPSAAALALAMFVLAGRARQAFPPS